MATITEPRGGRWARLSKPKKVLLILLALMLAGSVAWATWMSYNRATGDVSTADGARQMFFSSQHSDHTVTSKTGTVTCAIAHANSARDLNVTFTGATLGSACSFRAKLSSGSMGSGKTYRLAEFSTGSTPDWITVSGEATQEGLCVRQALQSTHDLRFTLTTNPDAASSETGALDLSWGWVEDPTCP